MVSSQQIYERLSTDRRWVERALVALAENGGFVGLQAELLHGLAQTVRDGQSLSYEEFMRARSELRRAMYVERLEKIAAGSPSPEAGSPGDAQARYEQQVAEWNREHAPKRRAELRRKEQRKAVLPHWNEVGALEQMWDFCSSFPVGTDELSIAAWTRSYLRGRRQLPPPDLRAQLIKTALAAGWRYGVRHWLDADAEAA